MTYTAATALQGTAKGSPTLIASWAIARGAARPDDVRAYLEALYRYASTAGLNADVLAAQSHLETDGWRSYWWAMRLNVAGLGVTGDPKQNLLSPVFEDGEAAARCHVAHVYLYAVGTDLPTGLAPEDDPRRAAAINAGYVGIAETLDDLNGTWAIDPQNRYGEKIAGRLNEMEAAGLLPADVEASPMADKPYILLVAGHRSFGDGGNPVERALTDDLAAAYLTAFRSAGYTADWFQAIDGDDDPTMTRGGLDGVALGCGRVLAGRRESLSIMLDLHFNGSRSPVHVIPPHNRRNDGRGALTTAYVQGRVADDVMANNPLDVSMASAIARQIVADVPGMTLLGGTIPGVMPESSSGVGLDGYRLAMMAATAPYRIKAVRLTIEHGGTDDAKKPDFFARCAQASLRAVNATLAARNAGGDGTGGGSPDPVPEDPEEEQPTVPALVSFLFGSVDGYQFDANGPVSNLWLEDGKKNDRYPRLTDVLVDGAIRYFVFSSGEVIVADGTKPVYWLEDVAA